MEIPNENKEEERSVIPGLYVYEKWISEDEEKTLIECIDKMEWSVDLKRRTQQFGYKYDYKYDYKTKSSGEDLKTTPIPEYLYPFIQRLINQRILTNIPDQVIINEYLPGQGIASHIDHKIYFGNEIVSLSLGSGCMMEFRRYNTVHG